MFVFRGGFARSLNSVRAWSWLLIEKIVLLCCGGVTLGFLVVGVGTGCREG